MLIIDDMADGMIDIIEPRLPINTSKSSSKERKYKWIKIYEREEDLCNIMRGGFGEVEIVGRKIHYFHEKKHHREICGDYAAVIIQRNVRMWLFKGIHKQIDI